MADIPRPSRGAQDHGTANAQSQANGAHMSNALSSSSAPAPAPPGAWPTPGRAAQTAPWSYAAAKAPAWALTTPTPAAATPTPTPTSTHAPAPAGRAKPATARAPLAGPSAGEPEARRAKKRKHRTLEEDVIVKGTAARYVDSFRISAREGL